MAKSTAMITDIGTVITNGPAAATQANSIAPGGPIMDYIGLTNLMSETMKEASNGLVLIKKDTDAGDGQLTLVNGLLAVLNGTSSPSTQALTDARTLSNTAFSAASVALAIAPGGPILDLVGMAKKVLRNFEELVSPLTYLHTNTDNSTDGANRTLLNNLLLVLV